MPERLPVVPDWWLRMQSRWTKGWYLTLVSRWLLSGRTSAQARLLCSLFLNAFGGADMKRQQRSLTVGVIDFMTSRRWITCSLCIVNTQLRKIATDSPVAQGVSHLLLWRSEWLPWISCLFKQAATSRIPYAWFESLVLGGMLIAWPALSGELGIVALSLSCSDTATSSLILQC
jgi:hypothetical protein